MPASCRRVLKFRAAIARTFRSGSRKPLKTCARCGAAAVIPVRQPIFDGVEQRLIPALQLLREAQRTPLRLPGLLWQGMRQPPDAGTRECLGAVGSRSPDNVLPNAPIGALVNAALVAEWGKIVSRRPCEHVSQGR